MIQAKTKIIKNIEVRENYYKIVLAAKAISQQAKPGQFVHVRVSSSFEPLLRRPFSIHSVENDNFEILYEIKGQGTKILSQIKPGGYLDVIGPLGNGFYFDQRPTTHDSRQIIIAGGIGVAPLVFLAEKLTGSKLQASGLRPLVVIGAQTKDKVLCEKEFKKLGCEVKVSTDDGSQGFKGRATDLLRKILLTAHGSRLTAIYACGPDAMLKELAKIIKKYNLDCQASLENFMGCGVGACLGCAIKTHDSRLTTPACRQGTTQDFVYRRVCKDGPVFNLNDIVFD